MKEDNSSPANKTYPGTIQRPIFRVKISQPLITWQCTGSPFPWRRPPNFHGLMPNQRWLEATHFEASLRIFLVGEGSLYADCTNLLPRHLLCSSTFGPSIKYLPERSCQSFTLQPRRLTSCASGDNCNSTYPTILQPDLDRGC
jgi:hypothetical protein